MLQSLLFLAGYFQPESYINFIFLSAKIKWFLSFSFSSQKFNQNLILKKLPNFPIHDSSA